MSGTRRTSIGSRLAGREASGLSLGARIDSRYSQAESMKDDEIDSLKNQLTRSKSQMKEIKRALEAELEEKDDQLREALAEVTQVKASVAHEKFSEDYEKLGRERVELDISLRRMTKSHRAALKQTVAYRMMAHTHAQRTVYFAKLHRFHIDRKQGRLIAQLQREATASRGRIAELEAELAQKAYAEPMLDAVQQITLDNQAFKAEMETILSRSASDRKQDLTQVFEAHQSRVSAALQKSDDANEKLGHVLEAVSNLDRKDQAFSRALAAEIRRERKRADTAGTPNDRDASGSVASSVTDDAARPTASLEALLLEHERQMRDKQDNVAHWDVLLDALSALEERNLPFKTALREHMAAREKQQRLDSRTSHPGPERDQLEKSTAWAPAYGTVPTLQDLLSTHKSKLAEKQAEIDRLRAQLDSFNHRPAEPDAESPADPWSPAFDSATQQRQIRALAAENDELRTNRADDDEAPPPAELRERLRASEARCKALEEEAANLERKLKESSVRLSAAAAEKDELLDRLARGKKGEKRSSSSSSSSDTSASGASTVLKIAARDKEALTTQLEQAARREETLQARVDELSSSEASLQQQLKSAAADAAAGRTAADAASAQLLSLARERDSLLDEVARLRLADAPSDARKRGKFTGTSLVEQVTLQRQASKEDSLKKL
eukprot:gene17130-26294_t